MPAPAPESTLQPFAYAIVRVVPRVERGESINAGIVLLCRPKRFLGARVALDEARLRALDPACDPADVRDHLAAIERIAAGDPAGGPIAALSQAERYHWLVAPCSTIIQPGEAHTGLTADPAATLEHLFATLVTAPGAPAASRTPTAPGATPEQAGAHAEAPGAHAEAPGAHAEPPGAHAEAPGAHAEAPGAPAGTEGG